MLVSGGTIILPVFYSLHHEDTSTDEASMSAGVCRIGEVELGAVRGIAQGLEMTLASYNCSYDNQTLVALGLL